MSASDLKSPSGSAGRSTARTNIRTDDDAVDKGDGAEELTSGGGDGKTASATGDEDMAFAVAGSAQDDATVQDSASVDSPDQQISGGHGVPAAVSLDASGDVASSVTAAIGQSNPSDGQQSQVSGTGVVADTRATVFSLQPAGDARPTTVTALAATTTSTPTAAAAAAPAEPPPSSTLIRVVSDLVAAVLQPLMSPGTGSPLSAPVLVAMLSAVRNELEWALFRRTSTVASQRTASLLADPTPNVLVIGVDGTNLSRILADGYNQNFFKLMEDATTGPASIVGHTTISNPSWTAILTGVWGEKTGVINNVFTPWTYDSWPTVFNQLEALNPNILTTSISNWNVISGIAGAGSTPAADRNFFVPQIEGDESWSLTDDAVGVATVDAIRNTAPGVASFLFSYFVGVDENGHMHGGASLQYADAIRNVDDNLGEILAAVEAWEAANPGEGEWTIIVVTDHGHQPEQGLGHGFQSPDETETFVIASGPAFQDGYINLQYEIVDTTPTVLTLFGGTPPAYSDGVSLTTLGFSDVRPDDLHQALKDAIARNSEPDIGTTIALSLRTIFGSLPYYVFPYTTDANVLPIRLVGTVLYVATNIPAQIVALLTGVTGANIFRVLPPAPPSSAPVQANVPDPAIVAA